MDVRDTLYYKLLGICSFVVAPPTFFLLMWTRGPRGFLSLFTGLVSVCTVILLIVAYFRLLSCKKYSDSDSKNILSHIIFPMAVVGLIVLFLFAIDMPIGLTIWLAISYCVLLFGLVTIRDKYFNIESANLLIDIGYVLGLILIIYTFCF